MPPRTSADIRQAYLDFFKAKGHAVISGASLVPENDPTVLFTTAGMHPLVPYLMGEKHPQGSRLTDVQLCVRTQDIDEVGDASHLTCFEMLGNWSLGDYFKKEAIEMSFEFLTKTLGIPLNMLAVTCFEGDKDAPKDEESAAIWKKCGIPEERIAFLPKKNNWWGPAGKTGPCGPDTEMFYWVGDGEPKGNPKTRDSEWMEIWNDVFMQYNKNEDGTFTPLKQQNVDTGMGLDRVAVVLQKVDSVYDTDAMKPIFEKVQSVSDDLSGKNAVRDIRIVVDHLKAATFMLAGGVLPSNVDRGYVLRRIIRRAIRAARKLGAIQAAGFCSGVATTVIDQYGDFYQHLSAQQSMIIETLNREEETFLKTLQDGMMHFQKVIAQLSGKEISGLDAFHLYDTYGFPIELTKEMAAEQTINVDEVGFLKAFELHQQKSRAGAEKKFSGGLADHSNETTKLHTATHLLNAALRKVLGDHVFQKGSNITAERLRFDFVHPAKMTSEQIKQVEDLVNDAIKADAPVSYRLMTVDEAKAAGAIGVFGDKYGEQVKVYSMGTFSKEICGGPHVAKTGMLGSFKIQKEESSSAGVRRIKAIVTGGPKEIEVAGETK
ncbi:MAG: alanine--tRNA ligase [Candidatus Peribacteraceae bacterium]|nr:alanine--tRNA ligase [Candidatus Peribacteraceae bacterium]